MFSSECALMHVERCILIVICESQGCARFGYASCDLTPRPHSEGTALKGPRSPVMINSTYIDTTPNTWANLLQDPGLQCRMLPDQWLMIMTGLSVAQNEDISVRLHGRILTIESSRDRDAEVQLGIDKITTRLTLHRRPRGRIQVIRAKNGLVHILIPLGQTDDATSATKAHGTDGLGGIAAGRMVTARADADRSSIAARTDTSSGTQDLDERSRWCGPASDS